MVLTLLVATQLVAASAAFAWISNDTAAINYWNQWALNGRDPTYPPMPNDRAVVVSQSLYAAGLDEDGQEGP